MSKSHLLPAPRMHLRLRTQSQYQKTSPLEVASVCHFTGSLTKQRPCWTRTATAMKEVLTTMPTMCGFSLTSIVAFLSVPFSISCVRVSCAGGELNRSDCSTGSFNRVKYHNSSGPRVCMHPDTTTPRQSPQQLSEHGTIQQSSQDSISCLAR